MKAYLHTEGKTSWTQPNIVTPGGVNLLIVDLVPGGTSAMHQTVSIDFSVCILGEIDREYTVFLHSMLMLRTSTGAMLTCRD